MSSVAFSVRPPQRWRKSSPKDCDHPHYVWWHVVDAMGDIVAYACGEAPARRIAASMTACSTISISMLEGKCLVNPEAKFPDVFKLVVPRERPKLTGREEG